MKKIKYLILILSLLSLYFFSGCDSDDPSPVSLTFNLTAAILDGSPISPTPNYALTIRFTAEGQPDGFSSTGNAAHAPTPSVSGSGTWSAAGNAVTFSSGGDSRTATANPILSPTSNALTLTFSLTKVDDGVTFAEAGTYVYTFQLQ